MTSLPTTAPQLQSTFHRDGTFRLALVDVPVPVPADDEVVLRVRATPVNPSDLGLLLGAVDMSTLERRGAEVVGRIPEKFLPAFAARLDVPLSVGNEGAGEVVAAGAKGRALLGKTVAAMTGSAMYAHYRVVKADDVLVLPDGATAAQGASAFVNPLTALSMVETLKREGHTALVHTAAASALGQMLVRICRADGVPLVNVVRSAEQVSLLQKLGAAHVVDSSTPDFEKSLTRAFAETNVTLGFDAVGGGPLAGQLLAAMERALVGKLTQYSRYGSPTHKQVYIYGALDPNPTTVPRSVGLAWGLSGFLVTPFLAKAGSETRAAMKQRVAKELTTTFATTYGRSVSLVDLLDPEVLRAAAAKGTGAKFLVEP